MKTKSPPRRESRSHSKAGGKRESARTDSHRDSHAKQLTPHDRAYPSSRERLSAEDRAAQEAHGEFIDRLAQTGGAGFVWLDE